MSNEPENRAHSILAASSCERWWNCPGSVEAVREYPVQPNIHMAEGTVAHDLAEQALIHDWNEKKLEDYIGEPFTIDGFDIIVNDQMVECVWAYVEYVRSFLKPGAELIVEEKVDLSHIHPELFAYPDCRIVYPFEKLFIIDFKYGAGRKVDAFQNKQLMYYAVHDYLKQDVEEVEMIIFQPRIEDGHIDSYCVDGRDIAEFAVELANRSARALKKDAPRVAGPWCKKSFCPAMATCDAAYEKAKSLVAKDFNDLPTPQGLNLKQIKTILENADFISTWLKKVEDYAKEMMLEGEIIPGYKLVESFGNRKWVDTTAVETDFSSFGDDIYEKKLLSPAKMEKLVGKDKVKDYAIRAQNGYRIVPEDAKGKAITKKTAKQDFD